MKKLYLYIFLVLMWCNAGFAEKISLRDIKLGEKLTRYFTSSQISEFNYNNQKSWSEIYSYEKKYSVMIIAKSKSPNIYKENYDYAQIFYENLNDKIVSFVGINENFDGVEGLKNCVNYRDKKISEYKRNKVIANLERFPVKRVIRENRVSEDSVWFENNILKFDIGFLCYIYPNDDNDFRLDYSTQLFNKWVEDNAP